MKNFCKLLVLVFLCSCNTIKYKPDLGFLNSAQANSMEYFVRVNNVPCKDMDNKIGLCAKRIASDQDLIFSMDKKPYSYRFALICTKAINSDFSIDVEEYKEYSFTISKDKYSAVTSFTCVGEVFPHNNDQEVSANFHIRVVIFDGKYVEREVVNRVSNKSKTYLVFGQHSKYINLNGEIFKKKPIVEINNLVKNFGYSESERMRFNYYGY